VKPLGDDLRRSRAVKLAQGAVLAVSPAATLVRPGQHARPYAMLRAAMSEKLALVRRWAERYDECTDVTEWLSLLDPEVELQTPSGPRACGHEQARDWSQEESENVRSRVIPDRFVEEGNVGRRSWDNRGAVDRVGVRLPTSPRARGCSGFATGRILRAAVRDL
jgi:hypothetical protein